MRSAEYMLYYVWEPAFTAAKILSGLLNHINTALTNCIVSVTRFRLLLLSPIPIKKV